MITLKTVLVATDFSDAGGAALEQGRALAAAFDASLHVLHVVTEPLHETWACYAPEAAFMESVDQLEASAQKRMENLISPDELASGRVTMATTWGDPSDEILNYARSRAVDLIVCGTHGRRGWDHLVMGSVAERVVHLAGCPVLTVHARGENAAAARAGM